MNTLYLDIETIPTQKPGAFGAIRETIKPPASMKKPETIAKWWEENGDTATEEAYRKTALDGSKGEIFCIGFAVNDGLTHCISTAEAMDERGVLRDFFAVLPTLTVNHLSPIVGHNVLNFDLRFLFQRAVINGVEPSIPLRQDSRPNGDFVFDTMTKWAGWGKYISLAALCEALGIESPKDGIDGSQVWDYVKAGRYEDVERYCMADVEAVRKIHKRMTFAE